MRRDEHPTRPRSPEHVMAQTLLDRCVRPAPAYWTEALEADYGAALDAALCEIVTQARSGDRWMGDNDLVVRIGAIILDRVRTSDLERRNRLASE